jgi:hypothetical protein
MPWRRVGEWNIFPPFLISTLGRRWVVSFTPLPLYPRGNSLRYPLYRRVGGPKSRTGRYGEETNILPPLGIQPTETYRGLFNTQSTQAINEIYLDGTFYIVSISGNESYRNRRVWGLLAVIEFCSIWRCEGGPTGNWIMPYRHTVI